MTAAELYRELDRHLIEDENPSKYLEGLSEQQLSLYPFSMMEKLKSTPQSPIYHPEGSAWNHTLLVTDQAALRKEKSCDTRVFMWAALLHDIGKPETTKTRNGRITSYDHEKIGARLVRMFLGELTADGEFIEKVAALVRWHMQILHVVKSNPFADIKNMKLQTSIQEVALLGLCDRLGRVGADKRKEEQNIRIFLNQCKTN